MNRYKVTIKETKIYECEVNADGGYESANKALELPDQWELIDYKKESIGAQLKKEGIRNETNSRSD